MHDLIEKLEAQNRREQLADSLKDIQVNLAIRGLLNGYLPPEQWEPLRLKLQNMYRRATGEKLATLVVQDDGAHHD